jgi:hypothetical protein
MDMNFPHEAVGQTRSAATRLRSLDMDILRSLAFAPSMSRASRVPFQMDARDPEHAMAAWLAGVARVDHVPLGSFNLHFADAVNRLTPAEHQGENGVYHCASVNRKAARLDLPHAQSRTHQAF